MAEYPGQLFGRFYCFKIESQQDASGGLVAEVVHLRLVQINTTIVNYSNTSGMVTELALPFPAGRAHKFVRGQTYQFGITPLPSNEPAGIPLS